MKISILGTGLSGLVGSRIVELLKKIYDFTDLSYNTGVDITNKDAVVNALKNNQANWILHLAAKTDVDACEKDKILGTHGSAWRINVIGTQNVVEAADNFKKKVLYISTDYVFDGNKDYYTENDQPQPLNWYAQTKYEGEKIVLANPVNLVVRIAYPYAAVNPTKKDFVHEILTKLSAGQPIYGLTDHKFTPTLIDDIAYAIDLLLKQSTGGIFHVVGSSWLTPYKAAGQIAQIFQISNPKIYPTTMDKYHQNRAVRPYKLCLKNDRISTLGLKPKIFLVGLQIIKAQGLKI